MKSIPLKFDLRKNCFVTIPRSLRVNQHSPLEVVRLQQGSKYIFASSSTETVNDEVVIGSLFAKANNFQENEETLVEGCTSRATLLRRAVGEPVNEKDWEILELNAEQVQSQLLENIRIVWAGAKFPIWISSHMHVTVQIVSVEPPCEVGVLAQMTELEIVPPKRKQQVDKINFNEPGSTLDRLITLLKHILPSPESSSPSPSTVEESHLLRVHPITPRMEEIILATVLSKQFTSLQPYTAFVSRSAVTEAEKKSTVAVFESLENRCYGNVFIVEDSSEELGLNGTTVLVTKSLLQQLHVEVRDQVKLTFLQTEEQGNVESFTFYTTEENVDSLKDELSDWIRKIANEDCGLIFNYGMSFPVQKRGGGFLEMYASFAPKSNLCVVKATQFEHILKSAKFTQFSWKDPPKFLVKPAALQPHTRVNDTKPSSSMDDVVKEGLDFLRSALNLFNAPIGRGASGCHNGNLLVTGARGSGRTSLARHLCSAVEDGPHFVYCAYVDCVPLKGKKVETLKRDWTQLFQQLLKFQPSILVLDDLDHLASCPHDEGTAGISGESLYTSRIADLLLELTRQTPYWNRVIIVATARDSKALHPQLSHDKGRHFFTKEINIPPLNHTRREKLLSDLLSRSAGCGWTGAAADLKSLAKQMDGYSAADIEAVVEKALHLAAAKSGTLKDIRVGVEHLEQAVGTYTPFGLHGISVKPPPEAQRTWADVGGLATAKQKLMETMQWPAKYPELFSRCPIRMKSAVLLYGAPGTGKTLLASAVAVECGMNFISVKGPELLSKYIGASEEAVRETFRRARSAEPCVLFFDEFDSLAPRRGHDSTGVTDRVVNQLLTELDGVEGQRSKLWVLAATSRPDLIDPALLRPGRFDSAVHCPLPDPEERLEILQSLSRRLSLDESAELGAVAERTSHFSGADLQALLYTAQLKALHVNAGSGSKSLIIRQEHLLSALEETQPSVSASERRKYQQIYENFSGTGKRSSVQQLGPGRTTLA